MTKTCPKCGSRRVTKGYGETFRCLACGFVHQETERQKLLFSKKASISTGAVIGIIIGVIVLIGIIVLLIIANQKGWFDNQTQEQKFNMIKLYLQARDRDSQQPITANYVIDYGDNIRVAEGITQSDKLTEIEVPNILLHVYCWNQDHYLVKASKSFTPVEIQYNSSKFNCDSVKIGNLSIISEGTFIEGNNIINLTISTSDWIYRPKICTSWTAGVISVYPLEDEITCDKGSWLNWSYYNGTTMKYTSLQQDYYRCGDCEGNSCEWTERCESVIGNKCNLFSLDIPLRYKTFMDKCFSFGGSIFNTSVSKLFAVKIDSINSLDELKFIIYDSDRRFNTATSQWEWVSELEGKDVALEDVNLTISIGGTSG